MSMRESERLARWLLHCKAVPESVLNPLWRETRTDGSDLAQLLLDRGHLDQNALENLQSQANKAWEARQGAAPADASPAPTEHVPHNGPALTMKFAGPVSTSHSQAPGHATPAPSQSFASNMIAPAQPIPHQSTEMSYRPAPPMNNPAMLGRSGEMNIAPQAPMMNSGIAYQSNPVAPVNMSGVVYQSNPVDALVHSTAASKSDPLNRSWESSQAGDTGEALEAQLELLTDFVVHEEISRGGMGVVFRAHYKPENAEVALKLMLAKDPPIEAIERFEREANSLTLVEHPNIVRLYDQGVNAGRPYFAMELIRGVSLKQHIKDYMKLHNRVPDYDWSCRILSQIGQALIYCHEKGIYHRDVKPENILIEKDPDSGEDRPVLVDFGLVKQDEVTLVEGEDGQVALTKTGEVMGTPAYMAPEQLEKGSSFGAIGPHTDTWGLAATLFYCLSGEAPYKGASLVNIYKALMTHDPESVLTVNEDVPAWLDGLVSSALVRESADRIELGAFVERLEEPDQLFGVKKTLYRSLIAINIVIGIAIAFFIVWLNADREAPVLKLPTIPELVNTREIVVEGTVEDASPDFVIAKVGGKTARAKVEESGAFRITLQLTETQNKVKFIAVDQGGIRSNTFETMIRFDEDPPTIKAPDRLERTYDDSVVIRGTLSEAGCVLKSEGAEDLKVKSTEFRMSVPIKVGRSKIALKAVDPAGNESPSFEIDVRRDPTITVGPKGDFKDLNKALKKAKKYTRIQVAPGTYVLKKAVINTILEIRGDPKAPETVRLMGTKGSCLTINSRKCRLTGLFFGTDDDSGLPTVQLVKVSSGFARIDHCLMSSDHGAGVGVVSINEGNKSQLVMESTVIENCKKGAIVIQGPAAKAEIRDCTISNNGEMGLWIFAGGAAVVERTKFKGNQRGIYTWESSTLEAKDCELSYSREEGYRTSGGGAKNSTVLKSCRIHHNGERKRERGVRSYGAHIKIIDCDIFFNGLHGIEMSEGSVFVLENSKIRQNRGHGLYVDESQAMVSKTAIIKNRGVGMYSSRNSRVSYKEMEIRLNERSTKTRRGGKFKNLD